jgi:hypothetical protein
LKSRITSASLSIGVSRLTALFLLIWFSLARGSAGCNYAIAQFAAVATRCGARLCVRR